MKSKQITDSMFSEKMYILKAIAIISVITAHSYYFAIPNQLVVFILGRFARMGVFTFFVLSGYYYKKVKFSIFIHKLLTNLVIPWIIIGTLMYGFAIRATDDLSFSGYINYIIGNGSSLYFCTMLFLIKILFWFLPIEKCKARIICYICICLTVLSLLLTAMGVLPQDSIPSLAFYEYCNPYLNLFNWLGIFSLGILMREFELLKKWVDNDWKNNILLIICCIIFIFCSLENYYSYWSYLGVYTEFSIFYIVLKIIYNVNTKKMHMLFVNIGKNTYPIFLLHYPLLSFLSRNEQYRQKIGVAVILPIICVIILYACFFIIGKIAKTLRVEKILSCVTGIKG